MPAGTVLLIPGFAGTALTTPASFGGLGPPLTVWLCYPTLVAGGWAWLGLEPDGVTPAFPGLGTLTPGGPLSDYYGTFVSEFSRIGWTVYGASIDWRWDLRTIAASVADYIVTLSAGGPVNVVGHSPRRPHRTRRTPDTPASGSVRRRRPGRWPGRTASR